MLADGERRRPARSLNLGCELHSCCRCADDERVAVRQLVRVPVVERGELADGFWNQSMKRRDAWLVARAAGDDHAAAVNRALVRGHQIAAVCASHGRDGRLRANWCTRDAGEAGDELHHFTDRHEAVRIRTLVVKAGQAALRVGGEQAQRIPALAPPRVRDLAALEHEVIDRPVGQKPADGEAGMAGPDDHRGDALDGDRVLTRLRP